MHALQPLSRISNCLRKKDALLCLQFEILRRRLFVAVVEPRRQPLRRREQINVARDETGIGVIVRLLNLRVPDPAVGLPGSGVVARKINYAKEIRRRERRCPADIGRIEEAIPASAVAGTRYDEHQMRMLDSER